VRPIVHYSVIRVISHTNEFTVLLSTINLWILISFWHTLIRYTMYIFAVLNSKIKLIKMAIVFTLRQVFKVSRFLPVRLFK